MNSTKIDWTDYIWNPVSLRTRFGHDKNGRQVMYVDTVKTPSNKYHATRQRVYPEKENLMRKWLSFRLQAIADWLYPWNEIQLIESRRHEATIPHEEIMAKLEKDGDI